MKYVFRLMWKNVLHEIRSHFWSPIENLRFLNRLEIERKNRSKHLFKKNIKCFFYQTF